MGKGLALLGVPILSGKKTLVVTSFTQIIGPTELLTNGDFSAWTGDNPNEWMVSGETAPDPEVTERDPSQGHADTKTVGGAANIYSSAGANIYMGKGGLTASKWYELCLQICKVVSGTLHIHNASGISFTENREAAWRWVLRNSGKGTTLRFQQSGATDITIDNASLKLITLNAQQTMPANAIVDFTYALPASPAAGDRIMLLYRISDASLEAGYNCWQAYLQRNAANSAWDFRLDSVNAGTATNRINVTGVGSPTTIRVICDGTKHNCYTLEGTTWTKRGAEVNVSWNDSATGINTIYCSGTTPTQLTATPL